MNISGATGEEGLDTGVHIVRGLNYPSLVQNLTHEMLHRLGLRHIPDNEVGVMNAHGCVGPDGAVCDFSEADLAECRRVNACR